MKRLALAFILMSFLIQGNGQSYDFNSNSDISFQIYPSRDAELYARLEQLIVSGGGKECLEVIGEMKDPDAYPKINFYRGYIYFQLGREIVFDYDSMNDFLEARASLKKAIDSKTTPKKFRGLCWELYIVSGIYLIETEKEVPVKELYRDVNEARKELSEDKATMDKLKQLELSIIINEHDGQRFWWQVSREEKLTIAIGITQTAKEGKNENTP